MTANSNKFKQGNKAAHRVIAGVLCGASVLSLVLSLVMPPISQAIANDAQPVSTEGTVMGGGSSSESTDVDNTGGDAENQNSDETEGDETGSSNSDEQAQAEDQLEGELQAEDGDSSNNGAVMAAAEGGQTETAPDAISSVDELKDKLTHASGAASFKLAADIETSETITLNKDSSNITLDLNGWKIKHKSQNLPLFNITGGATLTVMDSQQAEVDNPTDSKYVCSDNTLSKNGNLASVAYDETSKIPTKLTYYVTGSSVNPDGTSTTETLYKHEVGIGGAIVACGGSEYLRLINLYATDGKGGTFKLESGVITQQQNTQQQNSKVGSLVYAENGSTVNMSGGYVCGASTGTNGTGAGIMVSNEKGTASTLNLIGGVIADNCASSGGGVYAKGSAVKVTGGVISGNSTLNQGLGGGIMAEGGIVNVSGGYITNNRMAKFCGEDGNGCHGGAGLAANSGARVTISGGQITGNYSEEAGGGVYVTNLKQGGMAWLDIKGGYIASNVSYRSEGAGIRVGQRVDAMINGTPDSKVYITNNRCMSRFDWGGGGIFVQGCNETPSDAGRLFVYSSYISSNTAGGYGGGVAVCPTGKTLVTNTEGTAIFGNSSAGAEYDIEGHKNKPYKKDNNSGNDVTPHLSGGGHDKNQDQDAYNSKVFREHGHADFFLAAKAGHSDPIAAVIGKMLGGGDAKYSGSKERSDNKEPSDNEELYEAITIPANGGVKIYRSVGLSSDVTDGSDEAKHAKDAARTFITGNYSWDHGGGIMSNGDLYLGKPADTYVYPSLKLKATKALINQQTNQSMKFDKGKFSFSVYRKDSDGAMRPSWNDKTFDTGGCTLVGTAENDENGNITFDLGEQYIDKAVKANEITYYLVEQAGEDSGIEYDHTVYEIEVKLNDSKTPLMNVPKKENPNESVELYVHNCTIASVSVTRHSEDPSSLLGEVQPGGDGYYSIGCSDESKTFTNKYTPYTSSGSWTPKATKVVEGGEMKEFTLEFADNENFTDAKTVTTKPGDEKSQTFEFPKIEYDLDSLKQSDTEVPGRGASKTFTYYVHEKDESSIFSHYKFDKSVYKFTVVATDDTKGTINCTVTYRKGTVDSDGKWVADASSADHELTDTDAPTFTNTYSTSLPLSGMSGVTLTYLAGAAVLCAAAAWMHIRRKANAKGGERRE